VKKPANPRRAVALPQGKYVLQTESVRAGKHGGLIFTGKIVGGPHDGKKVTSFAAPEVEPGFTVLDEALLNVRRLARPRRASEMNAAIDKLCEVMHRITIAEVLAAMEPAVTVAEAAALPGTSSYDEREKLVLEARVRALLRSA
jgi:hypothetical protein